MNENNQNQNQKVEAVLSEALGHLESGKTPAEVLILYPEHATILQEVFSTLNFLKKEGESLVPSKEFFNKTIYNVSLEDTVTEAQDSRYIRKEVEGRPSEVNIITKTHEIMSKLKIIIPVGIVAVLALMFVRSDVRTNLPTLSNGNEEQKNLQTTSDTESQINLPAATGDVDDAVDALFLASSNEASLLNDETNDAAYLTADSQAISDFGQSYDANSF
jgi:hypothetical protein